MLVNYALAHFVATKMCVESDSHHFKFLIKTTSDVELPFEINEFVVARPIKENI